MPKMERMAFTKEKSLFRELGDMAAYAALSEEDRMAYDADLKAYRDMIGQLVCAKEDGREEGREEGRKEGRVEERFKMVRAMAQNGLELNQITAIAGISAAEVERILNSN